MKKQFILFLLFIFTLGAVAQERSEMEQVMEMHDKAMEKMPELVKLINQLQTASQNSVDKAKYELAIEELKTSNKSMQNWMVGFGQRFDTDEIMKGKELTKQKKEWLQEEKTKIIALEEEIDGALANAEKLLSKE